MTPRHPDCPGCCACLPPPPVDQPLPAPVADYLLPDVGDIFRPRDYFAVQVVHARLGECDLEHARAQLDAAWQFQQVHGRAALVDALSMAARMPEGLDGALSALLTALSQEAAA